MLHWSWGTKHSCNTPFALMTARTTAGMDSKGLCKNMVTWIQIWVKQLYYLSFRELHCFSLRNYLDSILCLYSNYKYPEVIWGKAKILGTFAGYFSHNKCTYASKMLIKVNSIYRSCLILSIFLHLLILKRLLSFQLTTVESSVQYLPSKCRGQ